LKLVKKHTAEPAYLDRVAAFISDGKAKLDYVLQ
jgi:hypothetical protein